MDKVIVYENSLGGMSVVYPAPQDRRRILVQEALYVNDLIASDTIERRDENGQTVLDTVFEPVRRKVSDAVYRDETDDEFLARVAAIAAPPNTKHYVVDSDKLPGDRILRGAWKVDKGKVKEDDAAAKLLVQEERGRVLDYLNDALAKEIAKGGDTAAIVSKLQQVDAILPQIDAAKTVAEVKAILTTIKELRSA